VLLSGKDHTVARQLEIGDSGSILTFVGPPDMPIVNFFERDHLLVELVDSALKVSTSIRDKDGNLIAEMIRIEWKVAPPPKTWNRNYTTDALEVRDATGNIVLQVRVLPDRIRLHGEWWRDKSTGVRLVSLGPGQRAEIAFWRDGIRLQEPEIKPMFVYPSDTHMGELQRN
jgi:hypothetical protein